MTEENPLVSQPRNNYFQLVILSILSLACFILCFIVSIILTSWILILLSLVSLLMVFALTTGFFRKKYLFYHDRIIVENFRDKRLREVAVKDIVSWNEYSIHKKGRIHYYLVIKTINSRLVIASNNYKNFEDFVAYFRQSGISKNKNLKAYIIFTGQYLTALNKKLYLAFAFSSILILSVFWSIISTKSDSEEKIVFTGKINSIQFSKRNVDLHVDGYPNLVFVTSDKRFFVATHYRNGESVLVNEGKTIELHVLKSDYDWLVKNKLIRRIYFSPKIGLTITDYTILD